VALIRGLPLIVGTAVAVIGLTFSVSERARAESRSIWSGIYSEGQAVRGARIYPDSCGRCHGARMNGAPDDPDMYSTPPIAGPKFLRDWDGLSVAAVYEYSRATMPANNPGFLSPEELIDIIAFMLQTSGAPAGPSELVADPASLAGIEIRQERAF
jgi:cytochrome c